MFSDCDLVELLICEKTNASQLFINKSFLIFPFGIYLNSPKNFSFQLYSTCSGQSKWIDYKVVMKQKGKKVRLAMMVYNESNSLFGIKFSDVQNSSLS